MKCDFLFLPGPPSIARHRALQSLQMIFSLASAVLQSSVYHLNATCKKKQNNETALANVLLNFSLLRNFDNERNKKTHQKFSSIRFSMEHDDAILTPSLFNMAALSMPLSSALSIWRKSPTLWETGRRINWHFSLRLGSGQTTFGSPRM